MSSSLPIQIAETIQTASIKHDPSPTHDLNPSTAASQKQPVSVSRPPASDSSLDKYAYDEDEEGIDKDEEEDIPYTVLKPLPRRLSFGPLPDLRFEQSYLASIANADTPWKVMYITIRDQMVLPLVQGTVWTLALAGWKYWNRNAQLSGASWGAKARRWWFGVNNWKLPESLRGIGKNGKLAAEMREYYQTQSSASD
ncbi:hypothetical protein G7Y89_g3501 [Cudoniella acicularis]|uniref:DUF1770-domain-containing protein n=1 Tax=Cudoniella acicularis TaxID=354080 RepID=A0A8H4RU86_9HELO|nr:hypothetical protein G7Y89_g3501 [Cudoniella acicularis]